MKEKVGLNRFNELEYLFFGLSTLENYCIYIQSLNNLPMADNGFTFELLVIDKSGQTEITRENNLIRALSYSEELWSNELVVKEKEHKIIDQFKSIELTVQSIGTSKVLTDYIEAGFIIRAKGTNFDAIESFRQPLLIHLRKKLSFTNIRILRDDVSTKISIDIYPHINKVENLLRRYLVLFFTQRIGIDWWSATAPGYLSDKIGSRKNNEKIFAQLCDTDVTCIDFDDLGELIYKQNSGFNRPETLVTRVKSISDFEGLLSLKQELEGNYSKYFKEVFQDNNFEKKWKILFEIRNKVAHHNLFSRNDYEALELVKEITKIIETAEDRIETFKFSIPEQEAILQATSEAVKVAEAQNEPKEKVDNWALDPHKRFNLKVIDKIDLPEEEDEIEDDYSYDNPFRIITEEELLKELEMAERNADRKGYAYLGLKIFVTKWLGSKGYAFSPSYSVANILHDKGLLVISQADDNTSHYQPKAITLKK